MVQIKEIISRSPQKDLKPQRGTYSFELMTKDLFYCECMFETENQELKYTDR